MENENKKLSIRRKLIYIVLFCLVFFTFFIYLFSSVFLLKSFSALENEEVTRNLNRIEYSIENIVDNQYSKLRDWAYWDDTYKFISDKNNDYIQSNLADESLVSLGINLIAFIDDKGEIIYSKYVNENNDIPTDDINSFIKSNITSIKNISEKDKKRQIIQLPEGDMIISVSNILKSDQTGTPNGILIFGKLIDNSVIDNISGLVRFPVNIYQYNSSANTNDLTLAKNNLSIQNKYFIHPVSNNLVYGYMLIYDISDKPIDLIKVELPRDIYLEGVHTIYVFLIMIILFILLLGFTIYFLLERFIIHRLIKLKDGVKDISKASDFSRTIHEGSSDEIGNLAFMINKMIKSIHDSQEKEKELNEEEKITNKKNAEHLEEIEKLNRLMIGRELKMIELKKEILELKHNKVEGL